MIGPAESFSHIYTKSVSLPVQYIRKAVQMKKILIGLLLILFAYNGFSQLIGEETKKRINTGFDVYTDFWLNKPEGVTSAAVNPGFTFFALHNWPIKEDKLKFATGLDISVHNMYTNSIGVVDTNSITIFHPFDSLYPHLSYKRIKYNMIYLDIPLEIRFKSDKKFRFSAGVKVGYLIRNQVKYVGDDFIWETRREMKVKFNRLENFQKWRYGVYARFGWNWINFYGFYSFSNVYEKGKGPDLHQISAGISIYPF